MVERRLHLEKATKNVPNFYKKTLRTRFWERNNVLKWICFRSRSPSIRKRLGLLQVDLLSPYLNPTKDFFESLEKGR